ncbi:Lipoprotein OS=Streptomyces alboniger OX=132473 GN=CP975_20935 PE=4 SV=1 [Streptomyces alboniger]
MNSTTLRRTGLSVAVAAALTGLAACGSGGSDGSSDKADGADGRGGIKVSPIAALRTVEKSTDKADTARVDGTTSMGTQATMDMKGVMGWSDGITGEVTVSFTGGAQAQQMKQLGQSTLDYRYLKNGFYANMGDAFAAKAGGGKHWIEYDYDTLAEMSGAAGEAFQDQMQNTTPNQSVKMLLASGDVKRVGEEDVRGTKATHYSGKVDVADFTAKGTDLDEEQLGELRKQFDQAGISTETIDIWVNDDDLLVKKVEKADTKNGPFSQTAYYSDYGTPLSVEKPPAADTMSFKDLMAKQQPAA